MEVLSIELSFAISVSIFLEIFLFYLANLKYIHFQKRQREASKELEVHQTVNAIVEIVKDNYLASN